MVFAGDLTGPYATRSLELRPYFRWLLLRAPSPELLRKFVIINGRKRLLLTFGVYSDWPFVATLVNTDVALVKLKWNGFGLADDIWAIIVLIAAALFVMALLSRLLVRHLLCPLHGLIGVI